MLLRAMLAAGVALGGVVVSAHLFVYDPPPAGGADDTDDILAATLSMAPISLGNPAAAAALSTRHPAAPGRGAAVPGPYTQTLYIGRGDILGSLLVEAGVDAIDANAAIVALGGVYDPRAHPAGTGPRRDLCPGPRGGAAGALPRPRAQPRFRARRHRRVRRPRGFHGAPAQKGADPRTRRRRRHHRRQPVR